MPCHTPEDDRVDKYLCRACKFLTREQMESVIGDMKHYLGCFHNLLEWYRYHLVKDIEYNSNQEEKNISINELKRLDIL